MNIAVCFNGFLRNLEYIKRIKDIPKIFSSDIDTLTVYYSCPTKIEETDKECFDKDYVLGLFKEQETDKIKVNISFRDYDKNMFVEKAKQLGLPYITNTSFHSHRIVSCFYGQSESAKLINDKNYNFIIITRIDVINGIKSIGNMFDNKSILKNEAYIWRTIPYISAGDLAYHSEGRFFVASNECVDILKELYNKLEEMRIPPESFGDEIVVGVLFNLHENIQKRHLFNLEVNDDFHTYAASRIALHYTKEYLESM
jgi:hypothetical protein